MPQRIVALVVGINAYHHAPLKNAVNDAKAVKAALESKGVQVFAIYDCNITELKAIVQEFEENGRHHKGTAAAPELEF